MPRVALLAILGFFIAPIIATCAANEHEVVMHTEKGDFTFHVEIADTPEARQQGLMFRTELAADAGMLFDFGRERQVAFWMQNTLIPLDMVFIGAKGTVKSIHANAQPMDTTNIPSEAPVRFVLEIAGGRAAEIGLKPGDLMSNPRVQTP
jgi:uncharacterized protein